MVLTFIRYLARPATQAPLRQSLARLSTAAPIRPRHGSELAFLKSSPRCFSTTRTQQATLNQVLHGCRKGQKARRPVSPVLASSHRPQMKGVCLRVGVTRPKKPNSGERKTARVRLSNGRQISAIIPGEGHNIQQHSVVLVRGGRSPDLPGVKYRLVRGAYDLGGVPGRTTSRSKFGTRKPKKATVS